MQTFLPVADFTQSAKILDYKRLGKQRVEARQLIDVLEGRTTAWSRHPCVGLWRGYTAALQRYFNDVSKEWIDRGYKHTMGFYELTQSDLSLPFWVGNDDFHSRHRAALLFKDPVHYGKFGWCEQPELNYDWHPEKA